METKSTSRVRNKKPNTVRALRGKCVVRFSPGTFEVGGIAASLLEDISRGAGRYVAEFLITEDQQRVTYGDNESKMTVVHRGARGLLFWDQRTRSFADISADEMTRTRVSPSTFDIVKHTKCDSATRVFQSHDSVLGSLRHEITFSRDEKFAAFAPALLRVLHCGPVCHAESGFPWADVAEGGLITRERTFVEGALEPSTELVVEELEVVTVAVREFQPPAGYRRLDEVMKKEAAPPRPPEPSPDEPTSSEYQAAAVKQALESGPGVNRQALEINEALTPDCLGSTRFGSVTATLHQDFLTVAANTVNLVAPLIGPTTIAGGTWTIPWLANLTALGATAPGSGIRCFLREPRTVNMSPGPAGGGRGLIDRLAFSTLYQRDAAGLMRTQRDFAAMTLPATLAAWGVGAPADANLLAAGGDLTMVSLVDQRTIVEAYELSELGVIRITGLPARIPEPPAPPLFSFGSLTLGPFTTPPLFVVGVAGIAGTVNFASLGGGPLVTAATIGSSGNIVLGLTFPTMTVTGTVLRAVTPFGAFVLSVGTVGFCLAMPFLCPLVATLVTLMSFVLTNITFVTATATGVTWTLDISYRFDPTTERVEPFVSLVSRTGVVTLGTFGPVPNLIANAVDSLIAALGNLFDGWGALLATKGVAEVQKLLRSMGLQLPVAGRQNELRAIGGGARSTAGGILQLEADIQPIRGIASQPFTTQVNTRRLMSDQQLAAHLIMRSGLNPQPLPPPPGPGPVITVGTFVGVGLSQNALNYYVFSQWLARRFEVTITDPTTIAKFVAASGGLFVRSPSRIHLWPAVAPRIEITPNELANGTRPLVLFFDDVRSYFKLQTPQDTDGTTGFIVNWELSCNFRSTATIDLSWPWVFSLRSDLVPASSAPLEPRSWEFADPNVPSIMGTVTPAKLAKLVDGIAAAMLSPLSGTGLRTLTNTRPWASPLPRMSQEIFPQIAPPAGLAPQRAYVELLTRRKALYALTAIDTALLELVDGSGSPTLNTLLAAIPAPGPLPTTVRTMRCAQGSSLRDFLLPLTGPPAGP